MRSHDECIMDSSPVDLQAEINRRLTLNWIIQGAAQHAFLTSHYLVRDELAAISPRLPKLYDKVSAGFYAQYWSLDALPFMGSPKRFWRKTANGEPPLGHHPLFREHGYDLTLAARDYAFERCRSKGLRLFPGVFSLQVTWNICWAIIKEFKHKPALCELAKRATQMVWAIPYEKLDASLTEHVEFGELREPKSRSGKRLRKRAAGYGGVLFKGSELCVVAKAWCWPLLSHELTKGTVELICLHGLNRLDEQSYHSVIDETDHIELEPWMLQTGGELWRRLLKVLPPNRPVAEMIMHIARLSARSLEALIRAVIEDPEWARKLLAETAWDGETDGGESADDFADI